MRWLDSINSMDISLSKLGDSEGLQREQFTQRHCATTELGVFGNMTCGESGRRV